ncbi:MAG TPA: PaaI family thioesterase [Solirubrobacteraceae bacterium]|jgi:1,4-dihydroxy-2-naphthoyl-CoA hydrolase|nr:PaaI family thioesterase [Solirubrobacteraceae bacterium]
MPTPTAQQLNAARRGLDGLLGLELLEVGESEVSARLPVREEIKQPAGLVHGGVYAAVAESLASLATWLAVVGDGNTAVGLSNSTSFLRPITEGTLHALATRLHCGRTTWVWDVRAFDDQDRTCALTRVTIAVRPARDQARPDGGPPSAA